jgi:hypothetical protein
MLAEYNKNLGFPEDEPKPIMIKAGERFTLDPRHGSRAYIFEKEGRRFNAYVRFETVKIFESDDLFNLPVGGFEIKYLPDGSYPAKIDPSSLPYELTISVIQVDPDLVSCELEYRGKAYKGIPLKLGNPETDYYLDVYNCSGWTDRPDIHSNMWNFTSRFPQSQRIWDEMSFSIDFKDPDSESVSK